jgi:hypothetical protein
MRKIFDPRPVLGDQLLDGPDDLKGLDKTDEELRREIGRAAMNAPVDWYRRGTNAARLLYARLISGLIPPDERQQTEQAIKNLIACGGWVNFKYDIQLIKYTVRGIGAEPGRPLRYSREQDHAERTAS